MAREIPLTQGKVALVDDADYERVAAFTWQAVNYRHTWYARRTTYESGRTRETVYMHRFILGAIPSDPRIDHEDRDGLNCRRANLRYCDGTQNLANQDLGGRNRSGYKGVSFHRASGLWRAQIQVNGKRLCLGYSHDPIEMALLYDEKAREFFGPFARVNFPR